MQHGPELTTGTAERLIGIAALALSIELVFFKFMPDVSTAVVQQDVSALTDFGVFERQYLTPGSVHYARFLGNYLLYGLAKVIDGWVHAGDFRLHPLRIAAAILTPVYAVIGAWLPLRFASGLAWARFLVPYGLMTVIGLYVFYPADMPSLACLSIAIYCLLRGRLLFALVATVLTGLFRETSFHMIWLVALCLLCDGSSPWRRKILWVGLFTLAFVAEYRLVRHFFPGPLSSAAGGVNLDPRTVFLDRGSLSLTAICSLGLAVLFPAACLLRMRSVDPADWRRRFFVSNCWVFPAWLIFYRVMNGNLSEFRMLFPVLIPCIYGISYGHPRKPDGTQVLE
jgi:hypothetical protein